MKLFVLSSSVHRIVIVANKHVMFTVEIVKHCRQFMMLYVYQINLSHELIVTDLVRINSIYFLFVFLSICKRIFLH